MFLSLLCGFVTTPPGHDVRDLALFVSALTTMHSDDSVEMVVKAIHSGVLYYAYHLVKCLRKLRTVLNNSSTQVLQGESTYT